MSLMVITHVAHVTLAPKLNKHLAPKRPKTNMNLQLVNLLISYLLIELIRRLLAHMLVYRFVGAWT